MNQITPPYKLLSSVTERAALLVYAIDDDEVDLLQLKRKLKQISDLSVEFMGFDSPESALATMSVRPPDVVFLDYYLDTELGSGILRGLREAGYECPIIMLTGQEDARIAAELMRGGASDYLCKNDLTPIVLRIAIESALAKRESELRRSLLQEQVLEVQKMESLATFAAAIGDEFKYLVNAVLGQLQLTRTAEDDEQANAHFNSAEDSCRQLLQRVQRLCELRMRPALFPERLNLTEVLSRSYILLLYSLPRGLQLEMRLPREPLFVQATEHGIRQIMMHLCANAATASRDGKVIIEAGTAFLGSASDPAISWRGDAVYIAVSDEGHGISPEMRSRFGNFPDTGLLDHDIPQGLGLPLVRSIVSHFNGILAAESNDSGGSIFKVYFPAQPASVAPFGTTDLS